MLPNEIIVQIFLYLPPIENARLMFLSRDSRELIFLHVLPFLKCNLHLIKVIKDGFNMVIVQNCNTDAMINTQLFSKYQILIHMFSHLLKFIESKSESEQKFYKRAFFKNLMPLGTNVAKNSCDCDIYLFVTSRKLSMTSKSLNDHYLFCPIHKCFVNFHLLYGCHNQVFKTIIDPMQPIMFDNATSFGNFKNLSGTLIVY